MYWVDNLKIKCMIFLTLIICSSTFFLSKVDAATYVTNMSSKYNSISTYSEISAVYEVIDFLKSIEDDYYVVFTLNTYNYYYNVFIAEKNVSVTNSTYYYDGTGSRILLNLSSSTKAMNKSIANTNLKSQYKNFQYYFENNNFSTYSSFDINPGKLAYILYSNIDFKVSLGSSNEIIYNDKSLSVNSKIPSYYDWYSTPDTTLKKESFYSSEENNGNSLKYIDIYFNKEDFQKQIKYELNYNDYNSEIESAFEFELAEISSFEIAYLIKDESGFYKWTKNNDIGVYIDHDTSSIPKNDGTGFNLTGIISLIYDDSVYSNIEQIKVSVGLSSAFKYSYSYYDNSNITETDIDDYYSNMLGTNGRLYRNKQYEKYSVISTKENLIKDTILVEYINTDYHLYLEYFDTNLGSYIDSSMLVTSDYFLIKNRDFEKYQYKIGTSIEKGLYLMNYLYHNNNENVDSYYWFYVSLDVEYYNTNYLDESYYYDNTGEIDQNIIQNPNSETDNIKFSDTFRPFFGLVDDLEATRILFNDSFKILYYSLPRMITLCLELLCHAICVVVLLQMLGWGDY